MKQFIKNIMTNALQKSVANNYILFTKLFLSLGGNPDALNEEGQAPLHLAVAKSNSSLVSLLLEKGADPDIRNKEDQTPLHLIAASQASDEAKDNNLITLLLAKNAKTDLQDKKGETPLHYAVGEQKLTLMKALLAKAGNYNLTNKKGQAPLHLAVEKRSEVMVKALLNSHIDPNVRNSKKQTPLHLAAMLNSSLNESKEKAALTSIMEALLEKKANPNLIDDQSQTPLHLAVYSNNSHSVNSLLTHQADPNRPDNDGCTVLHIAMNYKNTNCYRNLKDIGPSSPLYPQELNENSNIVEALLKHRADPNYHNSSVETPLYIAVSLKRKNIVEHLLQYKANPNLPNQLKRYTALHKAVSFLSNGMTSDSKEFIEANEMIELLLKRNADPLKPNLDGITPLQLAKHIGSESLTELLEQYQHNHTHPSSQEEENPLSKEAITSPAPSAASNITHTPAKRTKNKFIQQITELPLVQRSPFWK